MNYNLEFKITFDDYINVQKYLLRYGWKKLKANFNINHIIILLPIIMIILLFSQLSFSVYSIIVLLVIVSNLNGEF